MCNLACRGCYIESSPTNDALAYLTLADLTLYLDEIARDGLPVREIGFTGGEPFMNRDFPAMIALAQRRGFEVLVLTNAMRPLRRFEAEVRALSRHGLTFRVSLDHFTAAAHDAERGAGSFAIAIDGIKWLAREGFALAIAGRQLAGESAAAASAERRVQLFKSARIVESPPGGRTDGRAHDATAHRRGGRDVATRSPQRRLATLK